MPEQLTFLDPPPPTKAVPAWETLNAEQRTAIHALLARLMRQMIRAQRASQQTEEQSDD